MARTAMVGVVGDWIVSNGVYTVVGSDHLDCGVRHIHEARLGAASGKTKVKMRVASPVRSLTSPRLPA